ncbi:hypothetical protein OPQ81_000727 [Rhizoctonia solani]|nr:hypothetical protein OPQ81_000727 [Rhizoctonia solani]
MLRSPLDHLHSSCPDLATRLQRLAKQLRDDSYESSEPQELSVSPVNPEQIARHCRRMAGEYNDLLAKARTIPSFEHFLQPIGSNRLICAAQNEAIVIINCQKARCDALFITPASDDIMHLPLPDFTKEKGRNACSELGTALRCKGLRQRGLKVRLLPEYNDKIAGVLLTLWNHIAMRVLDFLGPMNDVSIQNLPHITWCPTGVMSFLPLHAAGDYSQTRSGVFDYAIPSYTPTLTALLASVSGSLPRTPRLLAIGQAHTESKAEYSELIDDQATTAAILDAMEQHDWVHLACHAHQNVEDPTKSGFYLHDGILGIAAINQRSFKDKGLVFLSACQTATGDEKLPDEVIHLVSGMLMAGYPSVIATM